MGSIELFDGLWVWIGVRKRRKKRCGGEAMRVSTPPDPTLPKPSPNAHNPIQLPDPPIQHNTQALKPQVDLATAVAIAQEVWGLKPPPTTSSGSSSTSGSGSSGPDAPRALDSYDDNNFYLVRFVFGLGTMAPTWRDRGTAPLLCRLSR